MKNKTNHIFPILCILLVMACKPEKKTDIPEIPEEQSHINIPSNMPDFNEDTAYAITASQVSFGPRIPNTKSHKACGDYLINKLKKYGALVDVQSSTVTSFKGESLQIRNIIGRIKPDAGKRIFIASHWDTRPFSDQDPVKPNEKFDGAVDGASGVGILLEIARLLSARLPDIGVDIILFDAEDYGDPKESESYCLGSQYFANHLPAYFNPEYGILLDMVSAPGATFFREGYSMQYAPTVVGRVWSVAKKVGYGNFFIDKDSPPITDDHYFINSIAGIPTIDIIHHDESSRTGFGSYWHTQNDNMKNVDKNTMQAVGQTLLGVIYSERPENEN